MEEENKNTIIIKKSGTFYEAKKEDVYIFNYLFKYKVTDKGKIGFPLKSLDKVLDEFDKKHINYKVYEGKELVKEKHFTRSNYNKYCTEGKKNYTRKIELDGIIEKIESLGEDEIKRIIEVIKNELK